MHKALRSLFVYLFIVSSLALPNAVSAADDVYYARCNLKVLKGNEITWVNWQSSPSMLPAGTQFKIANSGGESVTLTDAKTGTTYNLDVGASGEQFLEKFVSKKKVSIDKFPEKVQADIKAGLPRAGMTKEQVYIAMGPPAYTDGKNKTNTSTYKDIMATNLWVYERRRFAKRIGIEFDASSGLVNRTEGVWGK